MIAESWLVFLLGPRAPIGERGLQLGWLHQVLGRLLELLQMEWMSLLLVHMSGQWAGQKCLVHDQLSCLGVRLGALGHASLRSCLDLNCS